MERKEIDITDLKEPNAFILMMRARKLLGTVDRMAFLSEIPKDIILTTPTEQLPDWVYDKVMAAVQKRFNVLTITDTHALAYSNPVAWRSR